MSNEVHYVFRGDTTFAIHQGKVIASSTDTNEVERQVKQAFGPGGPDSSGLEDHGELGYGHRGDPLSGPLPESNFVEPTSECPSCGNPNVEAGHNFCPNCGEPLNQDPQGMDAPGGQEMGNPFPHDEPSPGIEMGGEAGPYMAKVTTPNGLKGTVLGKVAGLWGSEVTVRLENGRIVKLPVGTELRTEKVAAAPQTNPIERLEARLANTPDGTRESLVARAQELVRISRTASTTINHGVSEGDAGRLDRIVVTADVERQEIFDAIAHLDDVESIVAPGFSIAAAAAGDTPGVSREDASWLDVVLDDMVKQAEATNFTKLMDEGPEAFAAELPDVALADTGVTRQMASDYIAERTAGIDRKVAVPYVKTFLARVESCRRSELDSRKQTIHKEAAAEEDKYKDLPDAALFL